MIPSFSQLFLSLFFFSLYTAIRAQNTFVPDDNFEQALIDLGLDTGPLDDFVPTANIVDFDGMLNLENSAISNLTGIENFRALKQLFVSGNQLSNLDVSQNLELERLWCFNNNLSVLDVSSNTKLVSLRCENNTLNTLDVSNNTNISVLVCEANRLSNLDISNNTNLRRLSCGTNQLNGLDVSQNTNLFFLSCENNAITALNSTNNSNLTTLNCAQNRISKLDVSQNLNLINLNCSSNNLCFLNLNNGNNNNLTALNFEDNPNLQCVSVDIPNINRNGWFPLSFSGYVASLDDCEARILVDELDNVIAPSFTLPPLVNGNYFTEPEGDGIRLNEGELITTGQTIYIYNEDDCFSNESNFNIVISDAPYFIPKFFTPNNDGINDRWQILDTQNLINNISIYNRYGKLLKFLSSTNESWDGTYNNRYLPNDSYWYEIVLNTREVIRGYFAIKR